MPLPSHICPFISSLIDDATLGVGLLGSYARGDAGRFSDVDLLLLIEDSDTNSTKSYDVHGTLVVATRTRVSALETWFTDPREVVHRIVGLRQIEPILDIDGHLSTLRQRAKKFVWTEELQTQARRLAIQDLCGWVEEAHKGLAGLREGHRGKLLNASFGLSWGLNATIQLGFGICLGSDNDVYDEVGHALLREPRWLALRAAAFGFDESSGRADALTKRVAAGLRLFVASAYMLGIDQDKTPPGKQDEEIASEITVIRSCVSKILETQPEVLI